MTSRKPKSEHKPSGRPTLYREEYNEQARKLCLLGATLAEISFFFDSSVEEIRQWTLENPDFSKSLSPEYEDILLYKEKFLAKKRQRAAARNKKLSSSPHMRLHEAMRVRLWASLKGKKEVSLFKNLAFTRDDLISHLEGKFNGGMAWENYGLWHVDHIRPCASFDLSQPDQFAACWSLGNLQPLWASENIKKGAKYVGP